MRAHVTVQRGLDGERPLARRAVERLLAGVRPDVTLQVARLAERLWAVLAAIVVAASTEPPSLPVLEVTHTDHRTSPLTTARRPRITGVSRNGERLWTVDAGNVFSFRPMVRNVHSAVGRLWSVIDSAILMESTQPFMSRRQQNAHSPWVLHSDATHHMNTNS